MDHAHRPHFGLIVMLLMGLLTLSGCANVTSGSSSTASSVTTSGSAKILTKADQQISHLQIKAAIATLKTGDTSNSSVKNLLTGLKHYQKAATALNKNQLSTAKTYFNTLSNYQATTDATFMAAKTALIKQYQQVKLANSYYNSARDEMSVHELTAAKTNIDKLDKLSASHPVVKQLQQKTLAMKQAIMNYEASQSTSSGSDSSTVTATSSSSTSDNSTATTDASSTQDSSDSSSSTDSSTSSSTATSSADSETSSDSSSSTLTTKQILSKFKAASGVSFDQDDQFNVAKQTSKYYQIEVMHDSSDENVTNLTDIYRYYPASGRVTKQNTTTGEFG
ncbi:hypothetical protein [Lactiplantibacillus daowaiensis]|uniref:Lipoprotein n=1 Tax=Lactiplantibacillus daowaiensis TaxID=2559918 RepID=A0ABW1S4X0_9LACO|nr:hypothetical protein [Lactiplantibacillus daowaiensis]